MEIDGYGHGHSVYTLGLDVSGREHLVFVHKAAYQFPEVDGETCVPADESDPPTMADTFFGEPGLSATKYETDFASFKPRCDLLLNASAHAPNGIPTVSFDVGFRLGAHRKLFEVIGDRVWLESVTGVDPSSPEPFVTKQISYNTAVGGTDNLDPKEGLPEAYLDNPVGCGWHRRSNSGLIHGCPLPNSQRKGDRITVPWGRHQPVSLGPIGRGWPERLKYAGTYDQDWIDDVFPFLPGDFDTQYFQAAPADQQIAYLQGGETVTLLNLSPEGRTEFRLPNVHLPVVFARRRAEDANHTAVVDTVLIEPDRRLVHLTWRTSLPLERDIFEVTEAIVGPRTRAFWRARMLGKEYHPGLSSLGAARDSET